MLTEDQIANYSDRALMLAIYKDFSSRLDTLQSTMTNGISNLSTAVQTIATNQEVIMSKVDDALAAAQALAPQIATLKTAVDNLVTFVTTTVPTQQAAAIAAAVAGDEATAQQIIDALTADGATVASEATAAAGALPTAPPPAAPASPAP